jgi:hypothetical protein
MSHLVVQRLAECNDECMLITEDKNLQLYSGVHKFPVMSFAQAQADLGEREAVWRRAYSSAAIEQARSMNL